MPENHDDIHDAHEVLTTDFIGLLARQAADRMIFPVNFRHLFLPGRNFQGMNRMAREAAIQGVAIRELFLDELSPDLPKEQSEGNPNMEVLLKGENGMVYAGGLTQVPIETFEKAMLELRGGAPKVQSIPKSITGANGDLYIAGNKVYVVKRQDFLNIRTKWTLWKTKKGEEEIAYFEPTFNTGICDEVAVARFENPLYLIYSQNDITDEQDLMAFFVESNAKKISTFYLALPNMFDNGRVCLGNNNNIKGEDIFSRFESAVKIFNESTFENTDLWDNKKKALISSWFVDPHFKFINDPYNGKIKFVNDELDQLLQVILSGGV